MYNRHIKWRFYLSFALYMLRMIRDALVHCRYNIFVSSNRKLYDPIRSYKPALHVKHLSTPTGREVLTGSVQHQSTKCGVITQMTRHLTRPYASLYAHIFHMILLIGLWRPQWSTRAHVVCRHLCRNGKMVVRSADVSQCKSYKLSGEGTTLSSCTYSAPQVSTPRWGAFK